MTLETFFKKFELFADAPNAVTKLRELVLRLAFSGGLTDNKQGNDGVPEGWEKRTIESICSSLTPGFACSRTHQMDGGHVHLRTHNISTLGTLNFDLLVRIDPKMVDQQKASIRTGDILFNNTNSQELVGKTSLVDRNYDYGFSNHITRLRLKEDVYPGFVVYYLTLLRNSGYFAKLCTRWINQAAVNTETLKKQTIPLPRLDEQKRIVAKVDELMALCDRQEDQQQERERRHAALVRASLGRFAEAPTPANLDFLFHASYAIPPADLRKSILTLAIQGKLVPPDPNYEPAQEYGASAPFDLPASWRWKTLEAIGDCRTGKTPPTNEAENYGIGFPFIGPGQITSSGSITPSEKTITQIGLSNSTEAAAGDILMVCIGGSIGKAAICRETIGFNQQINSLRAGGDLSEFIYLALTSSYFQNEVLTRASGSATPIINKGKWEQIQIPLPPIAEQRRIVAKVDELMALVDAMEAQLATSRTSGERVLEAVVAELMQAA
jgi:type I restriction enzyme S subunit